MYSALVLCCQNAAWNSVYCLLCEVSDTTWHNGLLCSKTAWHSVGYWKCWWNTVWHSVCWWNIAWPSLMRSRQVAACRGYLSCTVSLTEASWTHMWRYDVLLVVKWLACSRRSFQLKFPANFAWSDVHWHEPGAARIFSNYCSSQSSVHKSNIRTLSQTAVSVLLRLQQASY